MSSVELKKLIAKESALIDEFLQIKNLLKGSYRDVHTKCGKPTCWCAHGKGHKHGRLSWKEDGHSYIRALILAIMIWR